MIITKVITVISQKGGVGKTSWVQNTGWRLAELGYSVILIDGDPQANLTEGFGINPYEPGMLTMYDVLMGGEQARFDPLPIGNIIKPIGPNKLALAPANLDLADAEAILTSKDRKEWFFYDRIQPLMGKVDFILIDIPPGLGFAASNSIMVSDYYVIPLQVHPYAYKALPRIQNVIDKANVMKKGGRSKPIELLGTVLTMYDRRNSLTAAIEDLAIEMFGPKVFDTRIGVNIKIAEAPIAGECVISYAPESTGAKAYVDLTDEVLKRVKEG